MTLSFRLRNISEDPVRQFLDDHVVAVPVVGPPPLLLQLLHLPRLHQLQESDVEDLPVPGVPLGHYPVVPGVDLPPDGGEAAVLGDGVLRPSGLHEEGELAPSRHHPLYPLSVGGHQRVVLGHPAEGLHEDRVLGVLEEVVGGATLKGPELDVILTNREQRVRSRGSVHRKPD